MSERHSTIRLRDLWLRPPFVVSVTLGVLGLFGFLFAGSVWGVLVALIFVVVTVPVQFLAIQKLQTNTSNE